MVTVSGYKSRQKNDGEEFIVLELTGGLELVQSRTNGNFYGTVRKCNIPCTFPAEIASQLVGSKVDGDIVRVPTEPYEYINKRTGEVLTLSHSYAYRPKGAVDLIGETKVTEVTIA